MVSSSFQIAEKLELLLTERESLYATWEDHKTELDQAYDLHVFLRDSKQIDTFTSTQEVIYNNYSTMQRWPVVGGIYRTAKLEGAGGESVDRTGYPEFESPMRAREKCYPLF